MTMTSDTSPQASSQSVTAELRKEKRDIAARHLRDTIEALDALPGTYVQTDVSAISACHPRSGISSTKRQLEKLLKSLKNAKV